MRELRLEGYAGCRELGEDGLSRWIEVDLTTQGVTRQVVVRQLLADLSQRAPLRAAFLQAGEQHAQLSHPSLSQVSDWGTWDTHPCIVRDPLVGTSLCQLLGVSRAQREQLSAALAAHVAHSLLSVLAYVAGQLPGSLHLDVRPERVQVSPSGSLHLSEFGLWSLLEPAERTRRRLDAGEVHYLAPEAIQSLPCDARSDLFSVGAILFELVSARRAFAGSTSLATAVEAAAGRRRDVRHACSAPDALCAFIERLLAHRPDARFQSATEALAALGEFSDLFARGQRDLSERVEGRAQSGRSGVSFGSQGAPRAEEPLRARAATWAVLRSGPPRHADVQTVSVDAPRSALGDGARAVPPLLTKAHRPAALAGVVTQFLFRPFQAREALAPPPLFVARAQTRARAVDEPHGEPPTLAPPPMSVAPRAPAVVAAAFPTFGSFVRASPSAHTPVLVVDQGQHLLGAPSVRGFEGVGSSHAMARRFAPRTRTNGSGCEPWRDPSRTVFFAKAYARGKTLKRATKMPWFAVVALSTVFGSSFLGSLYLLYRVLR